MAFSHGALASGHGNIDVLAPESKNTEAPTIDQRLSHLLKYGVKIFRAYAVDFNVHVFVLYTEEPVPDTAAHVKDFSAGLVHIFSYLLYDF